MNHNSYIAVGHGGEYRCLDGHEGSTPEARGFPTRCLHLGCAELTVRTGDGSVKANEVAAKERTTLPIRHGGIR